MNLSEIIRSCNNKIIIYKKEINNINQHKVDMIRTIIEKHYGVNILEQTRKCKVIIPRHVFRYILYRYEKATLGYIGQITKCTHATVINSIKVVENMMAYDKNLTNEINKLIAMIYSTSLKQNQGKRKPMIIAVDFDGTIVEHKFPEIGAPIPLAIECLKKLKLLGHKLILWTCRSDDDPTFENRKLLTEAVEYCRQMGVEFDAVNKNIGEFSELPSPKIYADLYIDDRMFPLLSAYDLWTLMYQSINSKNSILHI